MNADGTISIDEVVRLMCGYEPTVHIDRKKCKAFRKRRANKKKARRVNRKK